MTTCTGRNPQHRNELPAGWESNWYIDVLALYACRAGYLVPHYIQVPLVHALCKIAQELLRRSGAHQSELDRIAADGLMSLIATCEKQPSCAATMPGRPVAPAPSSKHLAP